MNRDRALSLLPFSYAVALRLRDRGVPDVDIAQAVDVPIEALPRFFEIAQAKLDEIAHEDG